MEKFGRKARCWVCKSTDTIKWGQTIRETTLSMPSLRYLFHDNNESVKRNNELIWFKKWVVYSQTLESISVESGISTRTLCRRFADYLNRYPRWTIPKHRSVNLVVDGTYFSNKICLFIYHENELKETLRGNKWRVGQRDIPGSN